MSRKFFFYLFFHLLSQTITFQYLYSGGTSNELTLSLQKHYLYFGIPGKPLTLSCLNDKLLLLIVMVTSQSQKELVGHNHKGINVLLGLLGKGDRQIDVLCDTIEDFLVSPA